MRIPGTQGIGYIAANFLRSTVTHADQLQPHEFSCLAEHALDLLGLAVTSARPGDVNLSRSRSVSINCIKSFIEQNLWDTSLDTGLIVLLANLGVLKTSLTYNQSWYAYIIANNLHLSFAKLLIRPLSYPVLNFILLRNRKTSASRHDGDGLPIALSVAAKQQ